MFHLHLSCRTYVTGPVGFLFIGDLRDIDDGGMNNGNAS